jgi:hypothetical protein
MPDLQKAAAYIAQGKLEEPIYQSPAGPISALDICFGLGLPLPVVTILWHTAQDFPPLPYDKN